MSISAQGGFVLVDVSGCSSHQLSESYQDFGLLCARRKVRWALVRTGDEDADTHYALRDVLKTVARIAGISLRLRLAVVARTDSVAQVCEDMREELRALGCDARVFRLERHAQDWLGAGNAPKRAAFGHVAVA